MLDIADVSPQEVLRYTPAGPTLRNFFASNKRRRCLFGPFGSGKSAACCQEIGRRARWQAPNSSGVRKTRWAVVRNTYAELKQTTVRTWQDWYGEQFGAFLQSSPFEHKMRYGVRDGTTVESDVVFLAMDEEKDVKKFLSLEVTGIYFNEVRELRQNIVNAADGRIGRYPSMREGGPTWLGIIADTNMPDEDHWLYDLYSSPKSGGWEFFHQPGGVMKSDGEWIANPDAENIENIVAGYYVNQLEGKSDEWIRVYLASEFGRLPTEGSYYFEELALAEREGRICDVPVSAELPVHTFWDIGVGDDMVIWFGQGSGGDWRWVDYYENSGKNLNHYARVLDDMARERRWKYGDDVWPHDGGHRDPTSQASSMNAEDAAPRTEVWRDLTGRLPIVAKGKFADGIEGVRNLMQRSKWDRSHCEVGLGKLRRYKRRYDKVRNVFLNIEEHDGNSHAAAAFRTAAMGKDKVHNSREDWSKPIKYPQMAIA